MSLGRETLRIFLSILLMLFVLDGAGIHAQNSVPVRTAPRRSLTNSTILQGGNHAATMQRLHVMRQYSLASVRTNPQVTVGEGTMDFTPLFNNPRSLINVAQRLHDLPQQVQVQEETADVSEVDQGLIIHQVLTYHVLPGACSNPGGQAQLARAGVGCFTKPSPAQREASFSTPRNGHFVADPMKRRAAIVASQTQSAAVEADAAKRIADLRRQLNDPGQRAAISAQIGAAETARLSSLSDDQLEGEIVNSATQRFEETSFIPRVQSSRYALPPHPLMIAPSTEEMATGEHLLDGSLSAQSPAVSRYPKMLKIIPPANFHSTGSTPGAGGDDVTDLDLGTYTYLTGFTIGHDYEWSLGVSTTINWCVIGCSSTYSVTLYAGFNYGFGLRFPIQTSIKYHNDVHPNNTASASVNAVFKPYEADTQDFASTGIDPTQIFNAQELVAQVGADAGFSYNLPIVGSNSMGLTVGVDLTQWLPAPYAGGKFEPPAPGAHGIDSPFIFDQFDLLGDLLNFGAIGGQVFPAININLHSNKLQFKVNDELSKRTTVVNSGQTVNLGTNASGTHDSHFSFGDPVYNLGFTLTPGLDARLFIDVAVWSQTWDWPVWLPQLAITIPSGGIDFACHAGTTCVLDFQPEHQAGMTNGLISQLAAEGCTRVGNTMECKTLKGLQLCQNAVKSNSILGVQSCDPGIVEKEENTADRTLTQGGCQRNGALGNYLCPLNGMYAMCQTIQKNGFILSCGVLVPTQADQILRRGGCSVEPGQPGNYSCPNGLMGLCELYIRNKVVASCQKK